MLNIKIIGLEALHEKCSKETIKKPLTDGIKKLVFALEREVKTSTVVDTDRLRSSVFSKYGDNKGMVGTNVQYAPFVEYGTARMEARHMEGGGKVLGQGMFSYATEQIKKKMSGFLKEIGAHIEQRWGS